MFVSKHKSATGGLYKQERKSYHMGVIGEGCTVGEPTWVDAMGRCHADDRGSGV